MNKKTSAESKSLFDAFANRPFVTPPRLEIVNSSSSRWQHQAKDAFVLNTNRSFTPLRNGGHFRSFFSPICPYTNSALCLRSNLSWLKLTAPSQNKETLKLGFYSWDVTLPSQCAGALPSPHAFCMFQSSQNSQAWKTPHLTVSYPATAKLGQQTLTTGNLNFQRWKKACLLCLPQKNGAIC